MSRTSPNGVLCWRAATALNAELALRHSLQHAARSAPWIVFTCTSIHRLSLTQTN